MKGKRDKLRAQGVRVRLRCETGVWRFNIPIKIGINSGVEGDAPQGKFYAETRRSLRTTGARCERVESRIPMRWSSSIEDFAIHGFPIGDSCHKGLSRPRREISPSMASRLATPVTKACPGRAGRFRHPWLHGDGFFPNAEACPGRAGRFRRPCLNPDGFFPNASRISASMPQH